MLTGRNDPCPCGRGKKFKECCGLIGPATKPATADLGQLAALMNAGRYVELEDKARELIGLLPPTGLVWQLLGVALRMQGKEALEALQKAAELMPADAAAHVNLGNALGQLGRTHEALASYQRALVLNPEMAEAHHNLGNVLFDLGQVNDAAASYRRALAINPDYAEAHYNLGRALLELRQVDEAVASYRRALKIRPDYAGALNSLGNALGLLGQLQDAVASYRRALAINPGLAEAHNNLGNALLDLGQLDDAMASYRQALVFNRDFAEAHCNIGSVLRSLGQLDEATASYRRALAIRPEFAEAHCNLGIALRLQSRTAEAETCCQRALQIKPDLATAITALAESQADQGNFARAEELFRRAVSVDRDSAEAWAGIGRLRKMTRGDANWLAQAQRIAAQRLPPRRELLLRYAIGKYFDDVQDFDQAFANYLRANELAKLGRVKHDRQRLTRSVDQIIRDYNQKWASETRRGASQSARPLFVVGMLRSGTTLAEQILASHPAVFGAGELLYWSAAAARYEPGATGDPSGPRSTDGLAGDYLRRLDELSADALRVVDKMPANFLHLGLIHAALPRSRIIHMRRHPVDTCLSIYFQHFEGFHSYANDLEDLAHFYREYARVMRHWQRVLPQGAILDVPYEGLVDDQEGWSRKMVDFAGLPWDSRCLDFYRTDRTVVTASKWQVRQKINRSSVGRWRNYERFLRPLQGLTEEAGGAA